MLYSSSLPPSGHTVIREKKCVRDFFCLDNPMGALDTLEESQVSDCVALRHVGLRGALRNQPTS